MIEVFNEISNRMISGICFHEQMADYFDFLNLHGLKRWHENQFIMESGMLRGLHRYVINHCNRLIDDGEIKMVKHIPSSWYGATRMNVDASTKRQAIRDALDKWYALEIETKQLFENNFKRLTDNNKIADANKVNELIKAVDMELKQVCRKVLEYKSIDYDLTYIEYQQPEMHSKYEQELKNGYSIEMC